MDKIFVGNVKEKETQYGKIINIGINEKDMQTLREYSKDGRVNLSMKWSKGGKPYLEVYAPKEKKEEVDDSLPF